MKKLLNYLNFNPIPFLYNYYKAWKKHKKIIDVLSVFFSKEDKELQKKFLDSFDFPENMAQNPLRFHKESGVIYYVLNFKSKEIYQNSGTKEVAYVNSIKMLEEGLPIGLTDFIEPLENTPLDDSFSILCTFKVLSVRDIYENLN